MTQLKSARIEARGCGISAMVRDGLQQSEMRLDHAFAERIESEPHQATKSCPLRSTRHRSALLNVLRPAAALPGRFIRFRNLMKDQISAAPK
jgi:hypothetical protein